MTTSFVHDGSQRLVLASGSATRAAQLEAAGLVFQVDPAAIDEAGIRDVCRADGVTVEEAASMLAEVKTCQVSPRHPDALVIGADQMLDLEGDWLEKPTDRAGARRQLERLSGRRHRLVSSVCVAESGARVWSHTDTAWLTVRPLTADFIDHYLDAAGDAVLGSVGAYQLEGLGIHLFSAVSGDHAVILGLPVLPLLGFLRDRGIVPG